MAVGGPAERNEDPGAASGGNFRSRNGPGAANNNVRPAEALRHVHYKGHDFGEDFAACVGGADRVIVAFAGLVHDAQLIFSRGKAVHGIHQRTIDRDRKSTRLNSSHGYISYAVFCLKKKKTSSTT